VVEMAERCAAPVLWFGRSADADVRADEVELDSGRPVFELITPTGSSRVRMSMLGEHTVANALAAAAVGHAMGLPAADIAGALSVAAPRSRWRMEISDTDAGLTVINDAYNANPESMAAALQTLAAVAGDRRTWAVLGPMRELGDQHTTAHRAIGKLAAELGIDRLIAVGPDAAGLLAAPSAEPVPDVAAAIALLGEQATAGDVVLVKASRSEGLEAVAEALLEVAR
jgi:UDP-N-acetylmuramoyl-tripeptide--D-alanyl-D-alanine ligase